jgi:hypothetical protein
MTRRIDPLSELFRQLERAPFGDVDCDQVRRELARIKRVVAKAKETPVGRFEARSLRLFINVKSSRSCTDET